MADSAAPTPTRDPALDRLDELVGNWAGTGEFKEGAKGAQGARVTCNESNEWLPGKFFVLSRGMLDFGGKLQALRVIGYDTANKEFTMHAFDSIGFARLYRGGPSQDDWHFSGEHERVTVTLMDSATMLTFWERSDDGEHWIPLCETVQTRAS